MAVPILVVTPGAGFGELICQVMEETGMYSVWCATTGNEGMEILAAHQPSLCILDADFSEGPLKKYVAAMRKKSPDLLVVLIPPDDDSVAYQDVGANSALSKPFYLPDLMENVEKTLKQHSMWTEAEATAAEEQEIPLETLMETPSEAPAWLQDVSVAARYLTRLSLEASSQASLVTKGDSIWAYAGELPQPAVEELAHTIGQYYIHGGGSDLARFIHLDATDGEYMLYATGLGGDFVLALVFGAEMPFSKMRAQANRLAQALATPPDESLIDKNGQMGSLAAERPPPGAPLLDDVPPPIPNGWVPAVSEAEQARVQLDPLRPTAQQRGADVKVGSPDPTKASTSGYQGKTAVSGGPPDVGLAETIASKTAKEKHKITLEPVSPAMYNLTYACVLIPRMVEHHLTGELATHLADLITQLCLAFGWRLEQLSVRPDYLLWMANVPPSTSPGYLMRIIRQHTSRRLFSELSYLAKDNPSGDFWAPGYLIMSGSDFPPSQLVKDFIKDTRKRQGIIK